MNRSRHKLALGVVIALVFIVGCTASSRVNMQKAIDAGRITVLQGYYVAQTLTQNRIIGKVPSISKEDAIKMQTSLRAANMSLDTAQAALDAGSTAVATTELNKANNRLSTLTAPEVGDE